MKHRVLLLLVIIAIFCSFIIEVEGQNSSLVKKAEFPSKYTQEDKVYGLSVLWSEIKYNFANIDLLDFDLDSLYQAAIPKVLNTSNDIEYFDELTRFMASMKDGHTEVLNTTYNWNEYLDYIPAGIVEIDKKFYFSSLRKGIGLNLNLLGAEIVEIEGVPTKEYVESNFLPKICSSTDQFRWLMATTSMQQGLKFSYFTGTAKTEDGNVISFSLQRNGETTRTPTDEYDKWPSIRTPRKQAITLEWINNDIAFLDVRAFTEDVPAILDSLMPQINSRAKGVIVDLRYNGGGSTQVAEHLQQYFTKSDTFLKFGAMYRINNGYGRSQGNYRPEYEKFYSGEAYETVEPKSVIKNASIKTVQCPAIFLIGQFSYSACEDLLVNMCELPERPLFVGEETGGSTGAPLVVKLPHGASARICTLKILYPYSKKPFVQQGVKPDIEIKQSIADRKIGRDVVKEEAVRLLQIE